MSTDRPTRPPVDPIRWKAASAELDELLEISPDLRADRLSALEARDATLAADVRAMLDAHATAVERGFLESQPPTPPGSIQPGTRVGAYQVRSLIGHGGMGSVWLADRADGHYTGHAAIKILNSRLSDDAGERRFRREGTILARLSHPNIARLIDAGVLDTGRPYLVLEHVEGLYIDDYCRRHHLDVATTLRLFLDVLAAVSHAHANLIVHRDLKPSNVLITTDGAVKLLDFGIATLLDHEGAHQTQTLDRGLTPKYASPEQMLGHPVTTATDVYALGALLYTLLAGQHPTGSESLAPADLLKRIVEQDPPPPSSVAPPERRRDLHGDLDRLIGKALHKAPDQRYPTVDAFADDVRRFLRHEPIRARTDTWAYRTHRFIRRRRRSLAAAALVTIGVVGLTVVYAGKLREERDRATREAQKAQRVSEFLSDLLRGADPYRNPVPGGEGPTVLALLDAGAARVDTELADQPALRVEMLATVGTTYERMGRPDKARPVLERAVTIARTLPASEGAILARSLNSLGVLLRDRGEPRDAEGLLTEAAALRRTHLGPTHPDLAITLVELSRALQDQGRMQEAEVPAREGLAIRLAALGLRHRETATSQNELALLLRNRGELREAEALFRENLTTVTMALGPDHPNTAVGRSNLATVLMVTGRAPEAETLIRESLASIKVALGEGHPSYPGTMHTLSSAVLEQGRVNEAASIAEEALRRGRVLLPPTHVRLLSMEVALGRARLAQGRAAEALPLFTHVLETRRTGLVPGDWRIGQAEALTGIALAALGERNRARELLTSATTHLADVAGVQAQDRKAAFDALARLQAS